MNGSELWNVLKKFGFSDLRESLGQLKNSKTNQVFQSFLNAVQRAQARFLLSQRPTPYSLCCALLDTAALPCTNAERGNSLDLTVPPFNFGNTVLAGALSKLKLRNNPTQPCGALPAGTTESPQHFLNRRRRSQLTTAGANRAPIPQTVMVLTGLSPWPHATPVARPATSNATALRTLTTMPLAGRAPLLLRLSH
jgi:hypothetical protein